SNALQKSSTWQNKASKLNIGQVLDLTLFSAYYLSLSLSRTQVKLIITKKGLEIFKIILS
ncbi:MAG: hypothetical protein KME22_07680, partial [Hassallia sp. WJT32-NPBG1]|nr:hypothetical protein [Hassallia sp. WJT32-NPBG1]